MDLIDSKQVAALFLANLKENTGKEKFGVKFKISDQELIYLLNTTDNTIRKREINMSGTLMEYTWRGAYIERLKYAVERNLFNPPGLADAEVKNLYH